MMHFQIEGMFKNLQELLASSTGKNLDDIKKRIFYAVRDITDGLKGQFNHMRLDLAAWKGRIDEILVQDESLSTLEETDTRLSRPLEELHQCIQKFVDNYWCQLSEDWQLFSELVKGMLDRNELVKTVFLDWLAEISGEKFENWDAETFKRLNLEQKKWVGFLYKQEKRHPELFKELVLYTRVCPRTRLLNDIKEKLSGQVSEKIALLQWALANPGKMRPFQALLYSGGIAVFLKMNPQAQDFFMRDSKRPSFFSDYERSLIRMFMKNLSQQHIVRAFELIASQPALQNSKQLNIVLSLPPDLFDAAEASQQVREALIAGVYTEKIPASLWIEQPKLASILSKLKQMIKEPFPEDQLRKFLDHPRFPELMQEMIEMEKADVVSVSGVKLFLMLIDQENLESSLALMRFSRGIVFAGDGKQIAVLLKESFEMQEAFSLLLQKIADNYGLDQSLELSDLFEQLVKLPADIRLFLRYLLYFFNHNPRSALLAAKLLMQDPSYFAFDTLLYHESDDDRDWLLEHLSGKGTEELDAWVRTKIQLGEGKFVWHLRQIENGKALQQGRVFRNSIDSDLKEIYPDLILIIDKIFELNREGILVHYLDKNRYFCKDILKALSILPWDELQGNRLLNQIGALLNEFSNRKDLILQILSEGIANPKRMERIFDMCAAGYISEIKSLLDLTKETPDDPFVNRLLERIGFLDEVVVQALLRLREDSGASDLSSLVFAGTHQPHAAILLQWYFAGRQDLSLQLFQSLIKPENEQSDEERVRLAYVAQNAPRAAASPLKNFVNRLEPASSKENGLNAIHVDIEMRMAACTYTCEREKQGALEVNIGLSIAEALIGSDGSLNVHLFDQLIELPHLKQISTEGGQTAEYIGRIFKFLKHADLQLLIESVEQPLERDNPAAKMIRHLCGLDSNVEVSFRHAKVAMLSALLTRPRQGEIGSCFVSCFVIGQRSTREGLEHAIKDYIELIRDGCIKRWDPLSGSIKEYTLKLDPHQPALDENALLSAVEELYSNMSLSKYRGLLVTVLDKYVTNHNNGFEPILLEWKNFEAPNGELFFKEKELIAAFCQIIKERIREVARFNVRSPKTNEAGLFQLKRLDTGKWIENPDDFRTLLNNSLKEAITTLSKLSSANLEKFRISKLLEMYSDWLDRQPFWTHQDANDPHPWFQEMGGSNRQVESIYYQTQEHSEFVSFVVKDAEVLCNRLIEHMSGLPHSEKVRFLENPERSYPIVLPGHSFNLLAAGLLPYVEVPAGEKVTVLNQDLTPSQVIPISDHTKKSFLKKIKGGIIDQNLGWLNLAFKAAIKKQGKEVNDLAEYGRLALKVLEHLLVKPATRKQRRELENALISQLSKEQQNQIPYLIIGDLNWNNLKFRNVYLAFAKSLLTGKIELYTIHKNGEYRSQIDQNLLEGKWDVPLFIVRRMKDRSRECQLHEKG